jgi:hypothetical protein
MPRPSFAFLVALCLLNVSADAGENSLVGELIGEGVTLTTGDRVQVRGLSLPDGLDRDAQQEILGKVAGRHPLDRFTRKTPVAPFNLEMESVKDGSGERTGQRVDLWFVAHGSLKTITDKELLEDMMDAGQDNKKDLPQSSRELTEEELAQRNLTARSGEDLKIGYSFFEAPVLERVIVSGVALGVRTRSDESVTVAARLEPEFADDPELPNRWRPVERDEVGRVVVGEAQPYAGLGIYGKATELVDEAGKPTGMLLIECHAAFHEPEGWFGGANLLRSKLPLAVQDSVRDFRRELLRAEAERE